MTQYLLSVYMVDGEPMPADDEIQTIYRQVAHEGDVITTDGPFPETKEQLGGFWIVDVADLDAAMAWATKASAACRGPVEVRPFQEEPEA